MGATKGIFNMSLKARYFELPKVLEARYPALNFQDHCYWRIALDNVFQSRWDRMIAKPAHQHLSDSQLEQVVTMLEAYTDNLQLLMAHNAYSLKLRKLPGLPRFLNKKTMKTKNCPHCKQDADVMYRIQYQKGKTWIFVCADCLPHYQKMPQYRYGGTWKGYRH